MFSLGPLAVSTAVDHFSSKGLKNLGHLYNVYWTLKIYEHLNILKKQEKIIFLFLFLLLIGE